MKLLVDQSRLKGALELGQQALVAGLAFWAALVALREFFGQPKVPDSAPADVD